MSATSKIPVTTEMILSTLAASIEMIESGVSPKGSLRTLKALIEEKGIEPIRREGERVPLGEEGAAYLIDRILLSGLSFHTHDLVVDSSDEIRQQARRDADTIRRQLAEQQERAGRYRCNLIVRGHEAIRGDSWEEVIEKIPADLRKEEA